MKKMFALLAIILGLFLSHNAYAAGEPDYISSEKINNFFVTIKINKDASVNVSEKIEYDFGINGKHGIIRNIPIKYQARGGNFNLRISDVGVENEDGLKYPFSESFIGSDVSIKIGDADKLVSGNKVYIINYKIDRSINYFDSYDELYWNVTGNNWPVTVEKSGATVILPRAINQEQAQKKCFFGFLGEQDPCLNDEYVFKGDLVDGAIFKHDFPFFPGQGLTIVFGFPKGIVQEPSAAESFVQTLMDNWIIVLPFITFFVMYYLWYVYGRDPKGKGVIIAQYDAPDGLMPCEVGTVIDEKVDSKDVSAEIINLAVNGYLKIIAIENKWGIFGSKDYYLEKIKEGDVLQDFDKKLMEGLFRSGSKVRLSELSSNFIQDFDRVKGKIYESTVAKGYFLKNPDKERAKYAGAGMLVIILSIFGSMFLSDLFGAIGLFSLIFSGIIIMIFSLIMPAKTQKGAVTKEYILGFKEYLRVAEKDRIDFHNAPEKNPERFEKLLPYAIVLGVEKEWAKQFEGIYDQSPSWYSDPSGARFNAVFLASNLRSFSSVAGSNLSPTSSRSGAAGGRSGFGGGGFSGGGFGGGGGGSW